MKTERAEMQTSRTAFTAPNRAPIDSAFVRDKLVLPSLEPPLLDSELPQLSDQFTDDLGILLMAGEHRGFERFREHAFSGLEEAADLRHNFNPEIPPHRIHSAMPEYVNHKVRAVWHTSISDLGQTLLGGAFVRFQDPEVRHVAMAHQSWTTSRKFNRRFIDPDDHKALEKVGKSRAEVIRSNRDKAQRAITRGDGILEQYIPRLKKLADMNSMKFYTEYEDGWNGFLYDFFKARCEEQLVA